MRTAACTPTLWGTGAPPYTAWQELHLLLPNAGCADFPNKMMGSPHHLSPAGPQSSQSAVQPLVLAPCLSQQCPLRYYADLAIAALQNHARDAYTVPEDAMGYPGVFAPLADVPPPMLEGNFEMHSNCLAGEQLRQAFVAELSEVAPPWPSVH